VQEEIALPISILSLGTTLELIEEKRSIGLVLALNIDNKTNKRNAEKV